MSIVIIATGIKIIRPTHRAVVERLGKFKRVQVSGITWIVPLGIDHLYSVNITEQITEAERQEIITKDNLNASVSAQVYFKVKPDDESVKNSFYAVNNYKIQIVQLAKTTLRNVIGDKDFADVNSKRNELNSGIRTLIEEQTKGWGIDIVRCEIKEIDPPKDVQETMNKVIKAKNEKQAAVDFATATETQADGAKRAAIKMAEGQKQSQILKAHGEAVAITVVAAADAKKIELVNNAANKYFIENAIKLKQLEVTQASLERNSKVILTKDGISPVLVIGDKENIIPIQKYQQTATPSKPRDDFSTELSRMYSDG